MRAPSLAVRLKRRSDPTHVRPKCQKRRLAGSCRHLPKKLGRRALLPTTLHGVPWRTSKHKLDHVAKSMIFYVLCLMPLAFPALTSLYPSASEYPPPYSYLFSECYYFIVTDITQLGGQ